jgi:hypothetical protein
MATFYPFRKEAGKVVDEERLHYCLQASLRSIMNGEYTLLIERKKVARSVSQNNLLWLWCACIARETGHTKEEIKMLYCQKFLQKIVSIGGEEVAVPGETKRLSTTEFNNFLDRIHAHAATELGIDLPLPEDQLWGEFERQYNSEIRI